MTGQDHRWLSGGRHIKRLHWKAAFRFLETKRVEPGEFGLGTGQISKRSAQDGLNLGGVARGLKEVLITLVLILYLTVFKSRDPNRVQSE